MIKNIQDKKIEILFLDEKIELSFELKNKIAEYWRTVIEDNPKLWDGEITCVSEIIETDDEIKFICKNSNYSHYIYDERVGISGDEKCKNLSAGALIETSDGYYVLGEMSEETSVPKMLQVPGGNADKNDGQNSKIDVWKVIRRETLEEINIDIFNELYVKSMQLKYYSRVRPNSLGYEIFAKVNLKMTSEELKEHFTNYLKYLKENKLELEFDKLVFLDKRKALEELDNLNNPKREYIRPLIEEDITNK